MPDVLEDGWGDEPAPAAAAPKAPVLEDGWGDEPATVSDMPLRGHHSSPTEGIDEEVAQAAPVADTSIGAIPANVAVSLQRLHEKAQPALAAAGYKAVPFGLGAKALGVAERAAHPQSLSTVIAGDPYSQDKVAKFVDTLEAEHPTASKVGTGIGMAGELAVGGAAEDALAGIAGRVAPGVVKGLQAASKARPVTFAALRAATEGAGYGAAGAAGDAASHNEDVLPAAAKGAAFGAATGGAATGAAGVIGKGARRLADSDPVQSLLGRVLGNSVRSGIKASRAAEAASEDIEHVLGTNQTLRKLNDDAMLGHPGKMEEYKRAIEAEKKALDNPRGQHYGNVEAKRPIQTTDVVGSLKQAARDAASKPGGLAVAKGIRYWAKEIERTSGNTMPILGLRDIVSQAQHEAGPVLENVQPGLRTVKLRKVAGAVKDALDGELNKTATMFPETAKDVEAIRGENRAYHALIAMKDVVKSRIEFHERHKGVLKKAAEHLLTSKPVQGALAGAALGAAGEAMDSKTLEELGYASAAASATLGLVHGGSRLLGGAGRLLESHPGGFAALRAAMEAGVNLNAANRGGSQKQP